MQTVPDVDFNLKLRLLNVMPSFEEERQLLGDACVSPFSVYIECDESCIRWSLKLVQLQKEVTSFRDGT